MKEIRKNEAFTLIELLAVVIILAIVALIATPIILNVINDAKQSANLSSVQLIVNDAHNYYAQSLLDEEKQNDINNVVDIYPKMNIMNKPQFGKVYVNNQNQVAVAIILDNKCYKKTFDSEINIVAVDDCDLGFVGNDDVNPTVTMNVNNELHNGWYNEAIFINVQVVDNESGVKGYRRCMSDKECNPDDTIYTTDIYLNQTNESAYVCVIGVDNNGNESEKLCNKYKIDLTPPTIIAKEQTVTITKGDASSIIDYFDVNYSISGGSVSCNYNNTSELTFNTTVECTAISNSELSSKASIDFIVNINLIASTTNNCIFMNNTCSLDEIKEGIEVGVRVNSSEIKNFYVLEDNGKEVWMILEENIYSSNLGSLDYYKNLITLTNTWDNIEPFDYYPPRDILINNYLGEFYHENSDKESYFYKTRAVFPTYTQLKNLGCYGPDMTESSNCPSWVYSNLYDEINKSSSYKLEGYIMCDPCYGVDLDASGSLGNDCMNNPMCSMDSGDMRMDYSGEVRTYFNEINGDVYRPVIIINKGNMSPLQ